MQCMYIHTEWVHYAMYVYTYRQNPLYNVYINIQTESIIQCMYIHTDRIDYIMCVYTYRQNPLYNVCIYIQTGSIIQCKYTVFTLNFLRHSASLILQAHQKKCIPPIERDIIIPPLPEGWGGILFYLCPSVQDIFRRTFLSNCWWQKSDIWSQASYRYTILW